MIGGFWQWWGNKWCTDNFDRWRQKLEIDDGVEDLRKCVDRVWTDNEKITARRIDNF